MRPVAKQLLACLVLLLALPAAAGADLLERESEFGSSVGPGGRFVQAGGIATDSAGRVYVTDTAAGRVEVYDNAPDGNRFIRTFGEGILQRPVGVVLDNRNRIYVADSARHVVVMFDSLTDGATKRRDIGLGPGTELGKLSQPRYVDADRQGWIYATERDTVRVQWFRPAGDNKAEPVAAFGVAEPAIFFDPEGIAREDNLQFPVFYVSDQSEGDGEVRAYDSRGFLLRTVAGPGVVSSPGGLDLDSLGRLFVADTGNGRVHVFGANIGAENRFITTFSAGLVAPVDVATAPGALVYVLDADGGRVVRLRWDDADRDGALDSRDNCLDLANPDQRDTDRDRRGDDCDTDDDNDFVPDEADACPRTRRGADANRDGCGDPRSRIAMPRNGKTYRRPPSKIVGTAFADELGVAGVEVAVALRRGRNCRWYQPATRRLGGSASCMAPVYFRASGLERWSARVSLRGRGSWRVLSRALQAGGAAESVFDRRNVRAFRVR